MADSIILRNTLLAITAQRIVRLRDILYGDSKSDDSDSRTPIFRFFENSRWRTDLHWNVRETDAAINCYGRRLIISTIGMIHLLLDKSILMILLLFWNFVMHGRSQFILHCNVMDCYRISCNVSTLFRQLAAQYEAYTKIQKLQVNTRQHSKANKKPSCR